LEQPRNIRAQINTYEGASIILSGEKDMPNFYNPKLPVWLVTMEGKWTIFGGPLPAPDQPGPEPTYFNKCMAIMDIFTGQAMSVSARTISTSE